MLTAVFEELMQADKAEEACRRFCPALNDHWGRAHDHLWAAQQEEENRRNERPEL
jgi:hypothetical protein